MTLQAAQETSDVTDITADAGGSGERRTWLSFDDRGGSGRSNLARFFIQKTGDDIIESKIGRGGGVEGYNEIVVIGGKTLSKDENDILIGSLSFGILQAMSSATDLGNPRLHRLIRLLGHEKETSPQSETSGKTTRAMNVFEFNPDNARIKTASVGELRWFERQDNLSTSLSLAALET